MTNIEQSYSRSGLLARWGILAFALFLMGTNSFVIAGVLPQIAHDLQVGTTDVGFTITAYALVVAMLAPAIAVALARLSRTTLMVAGLATFVLGVVIAGVAPDYAVFAIGRVVAAVGAAALVPTATAAAAAITSPERRGQAIAVVGIGFTLASAVGAPLGTALSAVIGWRAAMIIVALLAALTVPLLAVGVRRVPLGEPISAARRFAVLRDGRILMPLLTTLFIAAGFNLLYIFSSEVTGYTGTALAALLLIYGLFGIVGNTVSGPLTDRFGSRRVGIVFMVVETVALGVVALVGHSFVGLAIAFVVWGLSAFGSVIPVQHRLLAVDPRTASVAISWFSTALYVGIAVAPLAGAASLSAGDVALIPAFGAVATVIGLAAFVIGYALRGRRQSPAEETAAIELAEEFEEEEEAESAPRSAEQAGPETQPVTSECETGRRHPARALGRRRVVTPERLAQLTALRRARDLMDREYASPLDVAAMAATAYMSPAHFSRQFRAAYGETPYGYLMTRRIERAMALLRGGMRVTDACMAVGATSLGSFSSKFTEIAGETPSAYRARDHTAIEAMPECFARILGRPPYVRAELRESPGAQPSRIEEAPAAAHA